MNLSLGELSPETMITAMDDNLYDYFFSLLPRYPGAQVHKDPDILWYYSGLNLTVFNGAVCPRLSSHTVDDRIAEIMAPFKENHRPMYWWLSPNSEPSDLGEHLLAHGFTHDSDDPGMAVDVRHLNDNVSHVPDLEITQVDSLDELYVWCQTAAHGLFGEPDPVAMLWHDLLGTAGLGTDTPFRYYLARLDGRPVATSNVCLGRNAVGIYFVGTLPSERGKGIGSQVTLKPLLDAREQGYRVGVLESTDMGYGVYSKLGFKEYCRYNNYRWAPE